MTCSDGFLVRFAAAIAAALGLVSGAAAAAPGEQTVTFFVTSDCHYTATKRPERVEANLHTVRHMNELPGTAWPERLGGDPIAKPRGVVVLGDMVDDGDREDETAVQWRHYVAHFGLDGSDGVLRYPVFEGWGNHDGPPEGAVKFGFSVQAELKKRNLERNRRGWLAALARNQLHYSWDWGDVHLVQLNLYPADRQHAKVRYSPRWHDPQRALEFLKQDLEARVGSSGRPVVLMAHCGFDTDWWHPDDWTAFYAAVKPYNVVLYLYGHTGTGLGEYKPEGEQVPLTTINTGQTEKGFFVVEIAPNRLRAAYRIKNLTKDVPWDGTWTWKHLLDKLLAGWPRGRQGDQAAAVADICVAPGGSDDGPGTLDRPFATIARARAAARRLIAAGLKADLTVLIRGGTYRLTEPLVFGPEDGGTDQFSVTYAAAAGERVVLSGGRLIGPWKPQADGTWRADVPESADGRWQFRDLYVNGRRAVRAREPDADDPVPYFFVFAPPAPGVQGDKREPAAPPDAPRPDPGLLERLGPVADAVEVVRIHHWTCSRMPLSSGALTQALVKNPSPWCFLENARDLLDKPGEWFLDRLAGAVYCRPRAGEDMTKIEAVAPVVSPTLVFIKGTADGPVRNLHLRGLTVSHVDWPLPPGGYREAQACTYPSAGERVQMDAAVHFEFARRCSFSQGEVSHVGGGAIALRRGCHEVCIEGNHIFDVGGNGIALGQVEFQRLYPGPPSKDVKDQPPEWGRNAPSDAEVPTRNRIADNHVHACGVLHYGAVGIFVAYARGTTVAHNHVHDLPYTGISVGWGWRSWPTCARENIIEYNHIHDVMLRLADGGGIYTLGREPGSVIRGNYIHDVGRSRFSLGAPNNGMFLDEGTTDFVIEDNVILRSAGTPMRFHRATTNLVRRNVLGVREGMRPVEYNATDARNIALVENLEVTGEPAGEAADRIRKAQESAGPRTTGR